MTGGTGPGTELSDFFREHEVEPVRGRHPWLALVGVLAIGWGIVFGLWCGLSFAAYPLPADAYDGEVWPAIIAALPPSEEAERETALVRAALFPFGDTLHDLIAVTTAVTAFVPGGFFITAGIGFLLAFPFGVMHATLAAVVVVLLVLGVGRGVRRARGRRA